MVIVKHQLLTIQYSECPGHR